MDRLFSALWEITTYVYHRQTICLRPSFMQRAYLFNLQCHFAVDYIHIENDAVSYRTGFLNLGNSFWESKTAVLFLTEQNQSSD